MKKLSLYIPFFMLFLFGCNTITNDELIGGTWYPTEGYEDGEIGGEPNCPLFENGIQFIDDEKLVAVNPEVIYEYIIKNEDSQNYLYIYDLMSRSLDILPIDRISDNGIVVKKEGSYQLMSCYLERK